MLGQCHVNSVAILSNRTIGGDFLTHLELDEEYLRQIHHKLVTEESGDQNNPSRGFQEPIMIDKGAVPLYFQEDEPRSWSDWSSTKSRTDISSTTSNVWSEWSDWTNCVQGYRHRSRNCRVSPCTGSTSESLACSTSTTTVVRAYWSDWAGWSNCENGQQIRVRQCTTNDRNSLSNDCFGDPTESRPCDRQGTWSSWGSWSPCEKGQSSSSSQTRQRGCTSNALCDGFNRQNRPCTNQEDSSVWSSWGPWSECTQGKRSRTRNCQGPSGCVGLAFETSSCVTPGDRQQWSSWNGWSSSDQWSSWSRWSGCVDGVQARQRTCKSSTECSGPRQETKPCAVTDQPRTAQGQWGPWSECNGGFQTRFWICSNNAQFCGTPTTERRTCTTDNRVLTQQPPTWSVQTQRPRTQSPPVTWSQWSTQDTQTYTQRTVQGQWGTWSECNGGFQTRFRICSNNAQFCGTPTNERRTCTTDNRVRTEQPPTWSGRTQSPPVMWSQWSSWSTQDTQSRVRPSQWGSWSSWSTCNQGYRRRVRSCAGEQCIGNADESLVCHVQVQPVPQVDRNNGQQGDYGQQTLHKPLQWTHKNL
ncbi:hypothetical protein Btru_027516 [Bulinus truncatus]|nr:hypothetical protein Btru_027516 [Bulinus truncatus]